MTAAAWPARAAEHVLPLVARHGWNSTSFQVLEPGLEYWLEEDACVAYAAHPSAFVVAGAPIAAADRLSAVAARFEAYADRRGKRVCWFGVERRFLERHDLAALAIGEQPVWDPRRWEETLARTRSLREQLRRARAKGVSVRAVSAAEVTSPPLREAVEQLIDGWLMTRRMAPLGFLVDVQPFGFAAERRYFVAERGGELAGFLAAVPIYARRGWLFEDLLRDEDAPNGTHELLVDAAMRSVAAGGATYVTLGLAPLAGRAYRCLRWIGALSRELYDFEGVSRFKSRLRPAAWEPIYLAYPRRGSAALALTDTLRAFARGSLSRFGLETARRRLQRPQRPAISHAER